MSYLAFHTRSAELHLTGREVHHIASLAHEALTDELSQPGHRQLRAELGLPALNSTFFASQVFWLMSDGETHRIQGQNGLPLRPGPQRPVPPHARHRDPVLAV